MAKTNSFRKKGKVSIWVGVRKPNAKSMKGVDILKDLCGVSNYDLDDQEVAAIDDKFPKAELLEIIRELSYSSSFMDAAGRAASDKKLKDGYWALAQYDFAYNPTKAIGKVASDPLFLGVFDWNDAEDGDE